MNGPPPHYIPPQNPGPNQDGAIDAIFPTNPLAAASCWLGILSVVICGFGAVLGVPAFILGIMSLKRGAIMKQSAYGKTTSTMRSWIGIVTGAAGTLLGIAMLIAMLVKRMHH